MKKTITMFLLFMSSDLLAAEINIQREQWLRNLKPIMQQGLCSEESPFLKVYKKDISMCPLTVDTLFVHCTQKVPEVHLPSAITSVNQANQYGSVLAECISAHYMGGDALKTFITIQNIKSSRNNNGS